ncbi:hypothetical protein [Actinomadura rudentiformis]|uniref:DUF2029 domain-containing protein n=1 Tax=Actinomadura rudentiformis TaxID=359158 RepID=A0A6H9YSW5_9ACTN|nr:hypothetical protein [Actinomadura rudentiformis]KAB2346435.1 hypothetical protein F8566_23500 [Actinomadura rudentiformis]
MITREAPAIPIRPAEPAHRSGRVAVALWALLIAATFAAGYLLRRAGLATEDELPPLHAEARGEPHTWQLYPAIAVAVLYVALLPVLVRRLTWRPLLVAAWLATLAWTIVLALSDGFDHIAKPLDAPTEYPAGLDPVRADPAGWLRTFTDRLNGYPTHIRGHPPLPTLVFWALDAAGLRGTTWAAVVIILVATSAVIAIAMTVRLLAGEELARRALPFLVMAPLVLWIATAMDAFFLGVGAWGTVLVAFAAKRNRALAALGGGLLLGSLPYLSYGLLPLFAVPAAVLIAVRPSARVVAVLLCGCAIVPVAFTLGGFWWPDGVAATYETYRVSRGSAMRPYWYFLVADFAVLGLLVGPAVAHALPSTLAPLGRAARDRVLPPVPTMLVGAALLGTIALAVSGVTRGEVERIWVPYAAWMMVAAARHTPPSRGWLAAQAVTALLVQSLVLSEW